MNKRKMGKRRYRRNKKKDSDRIEYWKNYPKPSMDIP